MLPHTYVLTYYSFSYSQQQQIYCNQSSNLIYIVLSEKLPKILYCDFYGTDDLMII
jgi:hypothetical protein